MKPLLAAIEQTSERIAQYEGQIPGAAKLPHPQALKLRAIGAGGPTTSLCFVLGIEDPGRFADARDVGAYVGWCHGGAIRQERQATAGEQDEPPLPATAADAECPLHPRLFGVAVICAAMA